MKKLKKSIITVLAVALLLLGLRYVYGMFWFNYDVIRGQNYWVGVNTIIHRAYITTCYVSGEEPLEFTVPDDYNGIPIRELGFGISRPFEIRIKNLSAIVPEGYRETEHYGGLPNDEWSVVDIPVTVYLGRNIASVSKVLETWYCFAAKDGSRIYYHPDYYFVVSPENRNFRSVDGVLCYPGGTPVFP